MVTYCFFLLDSAVKIGNFIFLNLKQMILQLIEQQGFRRFLLYTIPILLYCFVSFLLNRLMIPDISLISVLGFEVFFLLLCYSFSRLLDLLFSPQYWYWGAGILMLFSFTASIAAYYYIYEVMPLADMQITREDAAFNVREFLQNCILGLFRAFTYGMMYFVLKRLKREARGRIFELERRLAAERYAAKQEAEKNVLRTATLTAQIYPHFLDNAFTMVAGMAAERNDTVMMDTVLNLSGLMGYLSKQAKTFDQLVYLTEELKQVDILLGMVCQQREDLRVVQKTLAGVPQPLAIPPLILLTLIENAIKYGEITLNNPLEVYMGFENSHFVFSCRNRKKKSLIGGESTKVGLQNISHRLHLLMPDRFELQIADEGPWFKVTLSIYYT